MNLGNPEAWNWLVGHVDGYITELKLDVYRNDNDINPLDLWLAADAPDRRGISEIRHVTGFLAFYDELLRRHPNLLIDNCCAGGRRNDIETLRRSVPLWKSDIWEKRPRCSARPMASPLGSRTLATPAGSSIPIRSAAICIRASVIDEDLRNKNRDYANSATQP